MPTFITNLFPPNSLKWHLGVSHGQTLHICGVKWPQKSLGGTPMTKISRIGIFWRSKMPIWGSKYYSIKYLEWGGVGLDILHNVVIKYSHLKMIQFRLGRWECPPPPTSTHTLWLCVTKYGLGLWGLSTYLVHKW